MLEIVTDGNIPFFWEDLREAFQAIIKTRAPAQHWTNMHAFAAQLDKPKFLNGQLYGFLALREALERDHSTETEGAATETAELGSSAGWTVKHLSTAELIPAAVGWLDLAANELSTIAIG